MTKCGDMDICPICGKEFYVYARNEWRYKAGNKLVCSYKCSQAYKKEQEITNHEEAKRIVSISPSCKEITLEDLTELYTLKCADLVSEIAECKKSGKYKNLAESLGREAILNTMLVNKLKIKIEVNREAKKYAKKLGRWDLWR